MPGTYPGSRWKSKPPVGYGLDRGHPLARGLAGLWLFNEGTGGPRDLVTGLRGSLVGTAAWSGGQVRDYATNDSVDTGGFTDISGPAGTVSWRFTPGFAATDGVAHYCLGHSDGTNEFTFLKYSNGNIYAGWNNAGGDNRASAAGTSAILAAGVARSYSIAWGPSGTVLYCNGAAVASSGTAPTTSAMGANFHWGKEPQSYVNSGAGPGTGWDWGMIHRGRMLSAPEVASLHADPYAPILAPATRRFFAASAGSPAALSGSAPSSSAASGTLKALASLAGSALAGAAASAALAAAALLSGSGAASSAATGTLAARAALSGAAASGSAASATLTGIASLSASAPATSSASGSLAASVSLSGSAPATSTASGSLGTGSSLSGSAASAASASGTLTARAALSAAASSPSAASATLAGSAALSGSAPSSSAATGPLSLSAYLAGSAASSSAASGSLAGVASLSGAAPAGSSASAYLSTGSNLAGVASSVSSSSAALAAKAGLSGVASGGSSAAATLAGYATLSGSASSSSSASGVLVSLAGLSGSASAGSSASGTLIDLSAGRLAGSAAASSAAAGTMTGTAAISGAAGTISSASGTLAIGGAFAGSAACGSSASGVLAARASLIGSAAASSSASATLVDLSTGDLAGSAMSSSTATGTLRAVLPWVASSLDPDLVAYLTDAIGQQVWAPLKRGLKYRAPVNVSDDPVVSYARVIAVRPPRLSGPGGTPLATYQIDVHGSDFDEVLEVSERVRHALDGFRGRWGSSEIMGVLLRDQVYGWLENEDTKKVGVYRIVNEVAIQYRESVRAF